MKPKSKSVLITGASSGIGFGAAKELIPLSLSLRWVDAHAELGMREWPGPTLFEAWLVELDVAGRP